MKKVNSWQVSSFGGGYKRFSSLGKAVQLAFSHSLEMGGKYTNVLGLDSKGEVVVYYAIKAEERPIG